MSVRRSLRASISALALSAAVSPAFAQQFYGGLLAEYGTVDVDLFNDSGRLSALSGVVGVRTDVGGGPFVFGGEVETSLASNLSMDILTGDEIDRLSRVRLYAGRQFGANTVFAAVGRTLVTGILTGFNDSFSGNNYGIGWDRALTDTVDLRVELIHDRVNVPFYNWDNTSLRVGALVRF